MRVPLSWLRDYVDWPWEPGELADRLTMAGVKVEAISRLGEGLQGVIAARVLDVRPHPNLTPGEGGESKDGHWVADLETGRGRRQVVAGIANMKPGDIVPYAPPGSVLPGGREIGTVNIRGVVSEGMLLSLSELVLGEKPREGEAILVLPSHLAAGKDLGEALGLPETVFELDLTPNYATHCQSILGVAREVAAQTGAGPAGIRYPDPYPSLRPSGPPASESADVTIADPDLCSRYVARVIRGVKLGPSPWLVQFRVLAAGMRPLDNIVDATNYVMLEYGQPLHAFDLEDLEGAHIIVRRARAGETIVTLDGTRRALAEEMLVIADEGRAVAVAGVMGGDSSGVTAKTRDVLLESAWFHPRSVRRTATRLGLASEASGRFEKGVDPDAVNPASARCAGLIAESSGGLVAPGSVDRHPGPRQPREVLLRTSRVSALMGVGLERAEVSSYLTLLGFGTRPVTWEGNRSEPLADGEGSPAAPGPKTDIFPGDRLGSRSGAGGNLMVAIPSWRGDVEGEADLIEEVARLFGYNCVPPTLPRGVTTVGRRPTWSRLAERARRTMVSAGFSEVVSFSLVDAAADKLVSPVDREPLVLANPLSTAHSAMRTSILVNLLEALLRNTSHAERALRLFEVGPVYWSTPGELGPGNLPDERKFLGAVVLAERLDASWQVPGVTPDFHYIKGLVELLMRDLGVAGWTLRRGDDRRFHPGRQAVLTLREAGRDTPVVEVGVFGELHPAVTRAFDIDDRVMALELDFSALVAASTADVRVEDIPRYPAVTRDVAVVLPDEAEAGRIEEVIRGAAGELGVAVELFDVYKGHPVPDGCRSTAWRVTYRRPERSLTDAEVDEVHGRVRTALEKELGATIR